MTAMPLNIETIDPANPGVAERDWQRLGFPAAPGDAELVGEINWATSAPGIDWPAAYALGKGGTPPHSILWVYDPDGTAGLDKPWYPGAWGPQTSPEAKDVARQLLGAFWGSQAKRRARSAPQEVLVGGLLDEVDLDRIADEVWPSSDRLSEEPPTFDLPEVQAAYEALSPIFGKMQLGMEADAAARRALPPEERRLSPLSELQRAAGRLLLRIATIADPFPEPETGCDFLGELSEGTPLLAWGYLDGRIYWDPAADLVLTGRGPTPGWGPQRE